MRGWLWGPVAASVLVRTALWLGGGLWALDAAELTLDTVEYHALAQSLASGEGFAYRADYAPPYEVEALRTPGYPAFVAAVYAVAGARPGWVLLLQILLDAATCALLALAFRPALGARGAGVAALVYALHPASSLFSVILLSESLFVFLLVAAFAMLWGGGEGRTITTSHPLPHPQSVIPAKAGIHTAFGREARSVATSAVRSEGCCERVCDSPGVASQSRSGVAGSAVRGPWSPTVHASAAGVLLGGAALVKPLAMWALQIGRAHV